MYLFKRINMEYAYIHTYIHTYMQAGRKTHTHTEKHTYKPADERKTLIMWIIILCGTERNKV